MPTTVQPQTIRPREVDGSVRHGSFGHLALTAFDAMSHAVAVTDTEGMIVLSNPVFDRLLADDGERLRSVVSLAHAEGATHGKREVVLADGRVLCLEFVDAGDLRVVSAEDITMHREDELHAADAALTDAVTGLGNRERLGVALRKALGRSSSPPAAAVLKIEVDWTRTLHETFSQPFEDALIRLVADRLRSALRDEDVAVRLGGDRFAVLQIASNQPADAAVLAERLTDLLGRSYLLQGHLLTISVSIGVAVLPGDGSDEEAILRSAGLALHSARESGSGAFRFYDAALGEGMERRRTLERDLRRALALRELSLAYQPQFNIGASKVTGFEALLRWKHPLQGWISPVDFIGLAEETGLIVQIGEWVIRNACREAARWPDDLRVAVNVSTVQFADANLVPAIISALAESGLPGDRLEIEITESALLGDHETALSVLQQIRALGVSVSMDDFGTGYSSLSLLRSFPFDKIKIDQSFVRGADADVSGVAIVRAIAALGESLGMTTTAEGVETKEQLKRIAQQGCTDAQGYLISRPIFPDQIVPFLSTTPALGMVQDAIQALPAHGRRND
ncbi:bifunctional diguanylate cyclase/phosphodiesterase [Terrihabitans rhizophilus]|uniref:Bifunctional diguanylate cyclase/phosphodiesterase n=1 Tax=Terrihabitans rhizophilus TaxID=3092662 RepID=A0ABU4RI29_9HYPH|nr:bifunctional diguanylate cyclase/phosphodiesterase [Terrihabitans sp. PJ23]MDX6804484.1 bifunctional diguanylate cyclase/phosphodiesterase [Terrihabitans sp. PJ23]